MFILAVKSLFYSPIEGFHPLVAEARQRAMDEHELHVMASNQVVHVVGDSTAPPWVPDSPQHSKASKARKASKAK